MKIILELVRDASAIVGAILVAIGTLGWTALMTIGFYLIGVAILVGAVLAPAKPEPKPKRKRA